MNDPTTSGRPLDTAGRLHTADAPGASPCLGSPATCGTHPSACGSGACAPATGGDPSDAASGEGGCCGGGAGEDLGSARRAVVVTGLVGVAVALAGLVIGGWVGFVLVALVAAGIGAALARSWSRLSLNDRLIRVAVVTLLLALAVVRAFPR